MKTRFFLFILQFLLLGLQGFAQQTNTDSFQPSMKYGKPSETELKMTVYSPDSAASAVVLYSKSNTRYDLIANDFKVIYNYEVKIKILKTEGTSYANIEIPYYSSESGSTLKESITQIDASAYNLEGGKVVRTKMKRDLIFEERLNKSYMLLKFSIPAVNVGTVFEYKYQLTSDFYSSINGWEAQKDIPVVFTQHDITIPEYFKFNLDMRGSHFLSPKDKTENLTYNLQLSNGQMELINCIGRHLSFTGEHLPGLRGDSYVWCPNDYRSGVNFELRGYEFPGALYKSFTRTWVEIDKMLLDDEDFGSLLKMRNPYREEMPSLGLDKYTDRQKKIAAIYTFLKKKISWNNQYKLYGKDVKKAIKNGTGSNADINFVLMSMLRDAQIPCYPMVMSCKDRGILPYTHPSIQKLNTFIVGIADTDTTFVYLDGSVGTGYINTLPPVLMVDRARLVSEAGGDHWVDLSRLGKNMVRSVIKARIETSGNVTGNRQTAYIGQHAVEFRNRIHAAKDSTDFINKLEFERSIKVKKFQTKGLHQFSSQVTETLDFEKEAIKNGELIYVNPLIFLHAHKCPFTQAERQLPLEMRYPEQLLYVISLSIPEGYAVEELPKSMNIQTEDGTGYCRYQINQNDHTISLSYSFASNKLLYPATEYKQVKSFWEMIAEKNNEVLVLKKL